MPRRARVWAVLLTLTASVAHAEGLVVWSYTPPAPIVHAAESPSGRYLASDGSGVYVLSPSPGTGAVLLTTWPYAFVRNPRARPGDETTLAQNDAVRRVDASGVTLWELSSTGAPCSDGYWSGAADLHTTDNNNYLIADRSMNRVLLVDSVGTLIWRFGALDCSAGSQLSGSLDRPLSAELLPSGNVLVGERNAVFEVTPSPPVGGTIVAGFGAAFGTTETLSEVAAVRRLGNGNWLVSDRFNHRILEIQPGLPGTIVWQFGETGVAGQSPGLTDNPTAVQLSNGNFLVSEFSAGGRMLEVSKAFLSLPSVPPTTEGTCTPLQLSVRDSAGTARTAPRAVTVTLSTVPNTVEVFDDAACANATAAFPMPAGTGQLDLYVRPPTMGSALTFSVVASAPGYETATAQVTSDPSPAPPGGPPSPPLEPADPSGALDFRVGCGCTHGGGLEPWSWLSVVGALISARRKVPKPRRSCASRAA